MIKEVEKLHKTLILKEDRMSIQTIPCDQRFVLQFWIPGLGDTPET